MSDPVEPHTFYVGVDGNDNNNGLSKDRALKTLGAAAARQPDVTHAFSSTTRTFRVVLEDGGDFHEPEPILFRKAANLEIIGSGGRGGGGVGIYGGTTIYTPPGEAGLTIGYRNSADNAWVNGKAGPILRNLHIRPDGTDTGGSTGLNVIGMSNGSFYDVAVAEFSGADSVGWDFVSNNVANGLSGGATMYNNMVNCTASATMTGIRLQSCGVTLSSVLVDGSNDSASRYLPGSTGILTTGCGHVRGFDVKCQGLETCIDASQPHNPGTIYSIQFHSLRMEASKVGVRSNQIGTHICGGTWDSGNLKSGRAGTLAFDMLAGAEFEIQGVAIGSVEKKIAVAPGAVGFFETPRDGRTYYGATKPR